MPSSEARIRDFIWTQSWCNTFSAEGLIFRNSECEREVGGLFFLPFFTPFSVSFFLFLFFHPCLLAAADKTRSETPPFGQLSVSKCSSSSFTGLKPWMDMFLTGVCLRGTLVIPSSSENNRVILSAEVRMRGRQGQQLCPGCWSCCYRCQLYETIHPPILCPDSPFELQNNDPTW